MARWLTRLGCPLLLLATAGCVLEDATLLVPTNPFGGTPVVQPPRQTLHAPASEEAAARVALVGQKVLAANAELGLRPAFLTIGDPRPEIFHRQTQDIVITEGLVKQCKTDGQLAAVVCHELGEMASERAALAGLKARGPEVEPPPYTRIGNDTFGSTVPSDLTYQAELAKYDKTRRRPAAPPPPPDPKELARALLLRAGYQAADLVTALPLLKAAEENMDWEKQLTAGGPGLPWTRRAN
jgi:hypothetical protein